MKLFTCQLTVSEGTSTCYGTRSEAQKHGKVNATATFRGDVRIQEVDIKTDKASIVMLMNGEPQITVLRTWKLSARGGLLEMK